MKSSTWEYASTIPEVFIREYHVHKTMSGRKRKCPLLKKNRFFDSMPEGPLPGPDCDKEQVVGYCETYDLSNKKIYTYRPIEHTAAKYGVPFRISDRKKQMQPYLNKLFDCLQQMDITEWHNTTALLDDGTAKEAKMVRAVFTNDMDNSVETTYFKVHCQNSHEPIWLSFYQVPLKFVRQFLFKIGAKIKQPGKIFKSNIGRNENKVLRISKKKIL